MVAIKKVKTKKEDGGSFDWRDAFSGLGVSFFKNFADSLADKIKHRIQDVIVSLQRSIVGMFLVLLGMVFALVSLAVLLDEILMLGDGFGYGIVGIFSILIGVIIIKNK